MAKTVSEKTIRTQVRGYYGSGVVIDSSDARAADRARPSSSVGFFVSSDNRRDLDRDTVPVSRTVTATRTSPSSSAKKRPSTTRDSGTTVPPIVISRGDPSVTAPVYPTVSASARPSAAAAHVSPERPTYTARPTAPAGSAAPKKEKVRTYVRPVTEDAPPVVKGRPAGGRKAPVFRGAESKTLKNLTSWANRMSRDGLIKGSVGTVKDFMFSTDRVTQSDVYPGMGEKLDKDARTESRYEAFLRFRALIVFISVLAILTVWICFRASVYEENKNIVRLQNAIELVEGENVRLNARILGQFTQDEIDHYAVNILGMVKRTPGHISYVSTVEDEQRRQAPAAVDPGIDSDAVVGAQTLIISPDSAEAAAN